MPVGHQQQLPARAQRLCSHRDEALADIRAVGTRGVWKGGLLTMKS